MRDWLRRIFAREKREFSLAKWEKWLDSMAGGGVSATGVAVTDSTALTWSVVWGCVLVLAQDMAKMPLPIYRRLDGDAREEARDHPLWAIFRRAANPFMTSAMFRQTMQKHLNVRGNAYAIIDRADTGDIVALWPRLPHTMTPKVTADGGLVYEYQPDGGGVKRIYRASDVFHLRHLSDDGITGLSPIEVFREGIGLGIGYQQHAANTFRNAARPSLVFSTTNTQIGKEKAQEIAASLAEQYAGISNAGKMLVSYGGMEPKPWGFSNKDAEFIESRRLSNEDACRIWRVPPHKVMDFLRASFSNVTETNVAYVVDTLRPFQCVWEEEIALKLMGADEREIFYAEHDNFALLKGTPKERAEIEAVYVLNGISTVNEVRRSHNWGPVEGGDENLIQQQMIPIASAGMMQTEPATAPVDEPGRAAALTHQVAAINAQVGTLARAVDALVEQQRSVAAQPARPGAGLHLNLPNGLMQLQMPNGHKRYVVHRDDRGRLTHLEAAE